MEKHLDRINEAYNGMLGTTMREASIQRIDWMMTQAVGERILDVGCSQGICSILLGRTGKMVLGIDIEPEAIAYANTELRKESEETQTHVRFICGDFLGMEFSDQLFDTIYICEVLEHLENPEIFVSKAQSLLVPGGRLVVTSPFGINRDPAHKKTFYLTNFYNMFSTAFSLGKPEYFSSSKGGCWIGVIAENVEERINGGSALTEADFAQAEQAFFELEDKYITRILNAENGSELRNTKAALRDARQKWKTSEASLQAARSELLTNSVMLERYYKERAYWKRKYATLSKSKLGRMQIMYWDCGSKSSFMVACLKLALRKIPLFVALIRFVKGNTEGAKEALRGNIDGSATVTDETKESYTTKLKKYPKIYADITHPDASRQYTLNKATLKDMKIAAIMDPFTLACYTPEANIVELTPSHWRKEIDSFKPDLLFLESAWEGKDKLWNQKVSNGSQELFSLAEYCKKKHIPIIFWSKEDPVHNKAFMCVAALADAVFTTDIDCIQSYRETLGHNRVYHLHFAAQPSIHNPLEKYERKDKFCFAGSYYRRYSQRCLVFDSFADVFLSRKGYDIYDRNYSKKIEAYAFPDRFEPFILGSLPPKEIDRAYKGYYYGVNMNSVQQSQTMFARRVFEMLASNTVTVGNYSRGVKNLFGNLTICTDDTNAMIKGLDTYCKDREAMMKYRLAGLRKVLKEHLYEDRLAYIVSKVFNKQLMPVLPYVLVVAKACNREEEQAIVSAFLRQTYEKKRLLLITDAPQKEYESPIVTMSLDTAQTKLVGSFSDSLFTAIFDPHDYYGPNYLLDLCLTSRWGAYDVIGKSDYYACTERGVITPNFKGCYRPAKELARRRAMCKIELVKNSNIAQFIQEAVFSQGDIISVDAFNYCENGKGSCAACDDLIIRDTGISMKEIAEIAENSRIPTLTHSSVLILNNLYPTPNMLYQHMFVHRRVKCYQEAGYVIDVMAMDPSVEERFREFDGLDVMNGDEKLLEQILEQGKIRTVCVHFLNVTMWQVLKRYADKLRIIIWCHGADVQPWWRRTMDLQADEALEKAKIRSNARQALWREVFTWSKTHNIEFVYVSHYLANTVFEDYNLELPSNKYAVIHNCIDTETFPYTPKTAEQRKCILSVRPYSSKIYANDLAVSCILELQQYSWFHELDIRLIGDGSLFEEVTAPLKGVKNVTLEKRFLKQEELAGIYKDYGICLIPTRLDTQGVSRDEAMSCSLVPVTNAVAAIPEFVNDTCGILAPAEDYIAMTDGIAKLYNNPDLFLEMSKNAANRVRQQTAKERTIPQEIQLIWGN